MSFKSKFVLALLFAGSGIVAYGQSADDVARLQKFKHQVNMPVVYTVRSKGTIKIIKDLSYHSGTNQGKMDIYEPPTAARTKYFPIVLLVHGKTPILTNPKEWGNYTSWGNLLAQEGFVTVMFTHGLSTPGTPIEMSGDNVLDALTFIKQHAAIYHIDTTKISVIAFSAGVPLLSVLIREKVKDIKCIVAYYGFMDITKTSLFAGEDKKVASAYSLVNYADSSQSFPPFFIARAGLDINPMLNESIAAFAQKACFYNIPFTLVNHPTGVHGFDSQNNDARTKEIIEQMLIFLKSHSS
jgi:acetyl esterase/lipase